MDIGVYGMGVMGQNFALNLASNGFRVAICNRSGEKVDLIEATIERAKLEGDLPIFGYPHVADFVASLKAPRKIVILVLAGKPVDDTVEILKDHLEAGDIVMDGGNEWFPNSVRRAEVLQRQNVHFVGLGISGGEEGARNGPSVMFGGAQVAFDAIEPIFAKCCAKVDEGACFGYFGPIGAGNYVKMVHNGK